MRTDARSALAGATPALAGIDSVYRTTTTDAADAGADAHEKVDAADAGADAHEKVDAADADADAHEKVDAVEAEYVPANGLLLAMCAHGRQDEYINDPSRRDSFDVRRKYLDMEGGVHKCIYAKVVASRRMGVGGVGGAPNITFHVARKCDLLNRVDLVIPVIADSADASRPLALDRIIRRIRVEIGGQCIDSLSAAGGLETQINTTCALMGSPHRRVRVVGGKMFVPLALAPFHDSDMAVLLAHRHHELTVHVSLHADYDAYAIADGLGGGGGVASTYSSRPCDGWELYANQYVLDTPARRALHHKLQEHFTLQSQYAAPAYTRAETLDPEAGVDRFRFKLNFNHPIHLIYFWGIDATKVTRVALELNGAAVYDGCIEALHNLQRARGLDVEPTILFFNQAPLHLHSTATINFSRIDRAELVIETTEDVPRTVHIVALNTQPIRYMEGMAGLAFSK
jgi:hypothetical protein